MRAHQEVNSRAIQAICNMLPLIPQDKANHVIYGMIIYYLVQFFLTPYAALAVVAVFAVGKEVYDWVSGKGTPEFLDIMATILGSLPLFILETLPC